GGGTVVEVTSGAFSKVPHERQAETVSSVSCSLPPVQMIKCTYCGIENDETVSACRSCGTLLNAPDVTSTTVPPPIPQIDAPPILSSAVEMPNTPAPRGKELKAGSAGIIFLVYFASQTLGSIIA